jgi:two-component system LytT family sensor kinase
MVPWTGVQVIWSLIPCIVLFYVHAYWLMPAYLFSKRKLTYAIAVLIAIIGAAFISALAYYLNDHPAGHYFYQAFMRRVLAVLFFVLASASLGAFGENARLEKARKEKETEHLRTELSFLRGQVNPHFMLNVLNSMVLMARKRSDQLEPALLELAGLMRYTLYEADHEKIRLEDELEYLRVYIDLQMLRFRDDVTVQYNTPACIDRQHIEPMLLIPIVENAFKHGIGLVDTPLIHIDAVIAANNILSVTVKNKYNPELEEAEKKPGIGLVNLKKRLDLIYPDSHRLEVMKNHRYDAVTKENWYTITLQIPLQ